jgi:hypothetical protein
LKDRIKGGGERREEKGERGKKGYRRDSVLGLDSDPSNEKDEPKMTKQ